MSVLHPGVMACALKDIVVERKAQDARFGEQNHLDGTGLALDPLAVHFVREAYEKAKEEGRLTWRLVLSEEVVEAFNERDPERLRAELVQVAAVACAWIEHLDRRSGR